MAMDANRFIQKWRGHELSERSACQQHFCDLCALVEHPTPADVDKTGESFTFEKGLTKSTGDQGWADAWKKGFFAWEYKGPGRDLDKAYGQLQQYREALENPPLLVVSDTDRIVIHTNFTATPTEVLTVSLDGLRDPRKLEILRNVFHHPDRLRPGATSEVITTQAARRLAEIARSMRERGLEAHHVARFLDRIVFCMFAEDIDLLPGHVFTQMIGKTRGRPERFHKYVADLFEAMAVGGDFLLEPVRHFNGNLFADEPVLQATADEIEAIHDAAQLDWSAVDPSIFGTLFERGMDPARRSQLGAHYTSRADIETLIEPVVMAPLRREWDEARRVADNLLETGRVDGRASKRKPGKAVMTRARNKAAGLVRRFHERLTQVKVLDPACGSGNFLYVTLQKLKDLEKEVVVYAGTRMNESITPMVGPWQLFGIELSPYAHDLAQMTVWIGHIQWMRANGFQIDRDPVLRPMDNFQCRDAILDLSDPENPKEPDWPRVDCIVGNPPFLGDKLMRGELGDEYVDKLRALYSERIPGQSDLCCYWFERARAQMERHRCRRAGLLATQGIRGGANRVVLKRIKETGDIFFAESDRPWILDGANVHVSMVGFDDGSEQERVLDSIEVNEVHANLASSANLPEAASLHENTGLAFLGSCKGGSFDLSDNEALSLLKENGNPHGRPNSDVVRPLMNSRDLLGRFEQRWIIDNSDISLEQACLYEQPHAIVVERVKPSRDMNRNKWLRENWWSPQRMRPAMRNAVKPLDRFSVTPTTSKHRIFSWFAHPTLPDHQLIVFARSDDYFFGVLHSRVHELWALRQGTRLETRPRYTPTTCFETFPFPWPPGAEPRPDDEPAVRAVADAAAELDRLREEWLNPAAWTTTETLEFPGSVDGPWARYVHEPDARGIGTVRYPRTVPNDPITAVKLKKRTLTNLYNERPTWLDLAHRKLDEAVFAAYRRATGDEAWRADLHDESLLEKLLALNLERAAGNAK